MLPSAFFRSWLVSESVLACFTLLNSFSTSAWPVVNAVPLARKPSSGMTAEHHDAGVDSSIPRPSEARRIS